MHTDTSHEMQADRWNKMAEHFGKGMDGEKRQKRMDHIVSFLNDAGFSVSGSRVLDIGCGPGSLALPLARAGADVTALDISPVMLTRLRDAATEEGLTIHTCEESWWTADIDALGYRGAFDLVLASMTPGVKDAETLDKMMACSKQFCYYSNFIRMDRGRNMHHEILTKILGDEPGKMEENMVHDHSHGPHSHDHGHGPGFLYPFMYLYTLGYRPMIRFNTRMEPGERDWSRAADRTIEFIGRTRTLTESDKEKIREYFSEKEKNPDSEKQVSHGPRGNTGMMIWNVKDIIDSV